MGCQRLSASAVLLPTTKPFGIFVA